MLLTDVEISLAGQVGAAQGRVVAARRPAAGVRIRSRSGRVPADLFKAFADPRSRSLLIETTSEDTADRDPDRQRRRGAQLPAAGGELRRAAADPQHARTELRREAEAQPR